MMHQLNLVCLCTVIHLSHSNIAHGVQRKALFSCNLVICVSICVEILKKIADLVLPFIRSYVVLIGPEMEPHVLHCLLLALGSVIPGG